MCASMKARTGVAHVLLVAGNYEGVMKSHSSSFLWTSPRYYFPSRMFWETLAHYYLTKIGGPCRMLEVHEDSPAAIAVPHSTAGTVKA